MTSQDLAVAEGLVKRYDRRGRGTLTAVDGVNFRTLPGGHAAAWHYAETAQVGAA
jgi:hypothetical protein